MISVDAGSSAEVRDATLTLDSGNRAVGLSDSSDLSIRNSKISGTATDELIRVTRGSTQSSATKPHSAKLALTLQMVLFPTSAFCAFGMRRLPSTKWIATARGMSVRMKEW